jgi:hypothetical protein
MMHDAWQNLSFLLALALAYAVLDAWQQRREVRRQRIRAEEADAWAGEHERTATALAAELDVLRQRHATLTQLYADAVRLLLAANYIVIHRNLEWKRRRQDNKWQTRSHQSKSPTPQSRAHSHRRCSRWNTHHNTRNSTHTQAPIPASRQMPRRAT